MNFLILTGTRNENKTSGIEKYLPLYLSTFGQTLCFEYPQFLKSISLLFHKKSFLEKITSKLYIYHSIGLLPFGRTFTYINILNHWINFKIIKSIYKYRNEWNHKTSIITFTPELVYLLSQVRFSSKINYYVIDDYKTIPHWKNGLQKKQFDILEKKLLNIAYKVIVTSNTLFNKYKLLHKKTFFFPVPSYTKLYLNYKYKSQVIPLDLLNIPYPIAGFIGSFYDWKIDPNFLIKLIKKFPKISFVFIGIVKINNKSLQKDLFNLPNMYYLGFKESVEQLPQYVTNFDICLIPYRTNQYGKSAYPVKIMEYLAMGKPVVTTALPSIKHLSDKKLIYWSKNEQQFAKNIYKAMKEIMNSDLIISRINEAKKNAWEYRIKQFIKLLNE